MLNGDMKLALSSGKDCGKKWMMMTMKTIKEEYRRELMIDWDPF